jgi:hypothetical protein
MTRSAFSNDPFYLAWEAKMPPIFVDTAHGPKNKLYDGSKAGPAAAKAEAKMQEMVKAAIDGASGFTTNSKESAKGYVILLKISKLDSAGHETNCSLSGEIVQYPKGGSKAHGKGSLMFSLGWGGHATATGTSDGSVLQCVEAIAESMMTKAIPVMRNDILKR